MRKIIALLITIFFATFSTSAADLRLSFRDYRSNLYLGSPAELNWRSGVVNDYVEARLLESNYLSQVYQEDALDLSKRFGGRYFVATTGCGTACQSGVLIDLKTGVPVAELPPATTGYVYRKDSMLLVVNPADETIFSEQDLYWDNKTYYFVWTGRGWTKIAEEIWPTEKTVATPVSTPIPPSR